MTPSNRQPATASDDRPDAGSYRSRRHARVQRRLGVTQSGRDLCPDRSGANGYQRCESQYRHRQRGRHVHSGSHQTTVSGRALQGSTLLISRSNVPIEKAFMFLPSQPMINMPSGQRATG